MDTKRSFEQQTGEWRIRVGAVFDVEEAKACIHRYRDFKEDRPRRLVFDLTGTRNLHTAGLGAMLFIRGCCQVHDADAHIVYQDPHIDMILRLAKLERWFTLLPQGAARAGDRSPTHPAPGQGPRPEHSVMGR